MKKIFYLIAGIAIVVIGVYLFNYLQIIQPVNNRLSKDGRNSGVDIEVRYNTYVLPSSLVINLAGVTGDKSQVDVFRVLLQVSEALKEKDFTEVLLESKGEVKFKLPGSYFKELGQGYEKQNPMYTVRTFPENVLNVDGANAYGRVTGGLFGVFAKQMDDFKDFSEKWYLNDLKVSN
jgi:hypothetical protein